jgi:hypothetical protein
MMGHQAIGLTQPALLDDFPAKECQKRLPVSIIGIDIGVGIAAGRDRVEGAGEFKTELSSHR